jgi:hypothetical protein
MQNKDAIKSKSPTINNLFQDTKSFQNIYLNIFFITRLPILDWYQDSYKFILIIITAILMQHIVHEIFEIKSKASRSELILALRLYSFCKTNHYDIVILAAIYSFGSKFLIRKKLKYILSIRCILK